LAIVPAGRFSCGCHEFSLDGKPAHFTMKWPSSSRKQTSRSTLSVSGAEDILFYVPELFFFEDLDLDTQLGVTQNT
jgi:hypothetical protein